MQIHRRTNPGTEFLVYPRQQRHPNHRPQIRIQPLALLCAITMIAPTNGPNAANWKPIPRQGLPNWWRFGNVSRRSPSPPLCDCGNPASAPQSESKPKSKQRLFAECSQEELLGYGVPRSGFEDVRKADEVDLLALADHLPAEAWKRWFNWATRVERLWSRFRSQRNRPLAHPDAQRRFRVLRNVEELEAAFANPWEKWILSLADPSQGRTGGKGVYRAGTGFRIRWTRHNHCGPASAVFLARRHPEARVLLTTFSETLANALRARLLRLLASEPKLGERLEVHDLNAIGRRLYELNSPHTGGG